MVMKFSRFLRRFSKIPQDSSILNQLQGVKRTHQGIFAMMFTCMKCNTRSTKTFSKHSYYNGVVLVRCGGCNGLHLVADNLGWFNDKSTSIESIMQQKGKSVTRIDNVDEVIEFLKH